MEKSKYYRVETIGMILEEGNRLYVPEVLEKQYIITKNDGSKAINTKYESFPMYAELVDKILYDIITGDKIEFEVNDRASKISSEPKLIPVNLKETSATEVISWLIQLKEDDIIRYISKINNIKKYYPNTYTFDDAKNKKNSSKISEFETKLAQEYIEEFKKQIILLKKETKYKRSKVM